MIAPSSSDAFDADALQALLGAPRAEQGRAAMQNPIPKTWRDWFNPENESVLDSTGERVARKVGRFLGLDDLTSQALAVLNPTEVAAGPLAKLLGRAKPTVKNLAREPHQFNQLMLDLLTDPHAPKAGRQLEQSLGDINARRGAKPGPASAPGITAYHSSPHDFDKFSSEFIGTGEGAQSYGHGLYFAEDPKVAKYYRESLSPDSGYGQSATEWMTKYGDRDAAIAAAKQRQQTAIDFAKRFDPRDETRTAAVYQRLIDDLQAGRYSRTYEVNINAHPNDFLDWDAPLSQQKHGPTVAEAVSRTRAERPFSTPVGMTNREGAFVYGEPADVPSAMEFIDRTLGRGKSSEMMREAGIPGIKYLDAGSRGAGQGTRNYVVFDDKIIDIVKKYGIAAALSAGLINQLQAQQLQAQGAQ